MQLACCHFIYLETHPHITPKHSLSSTVYSDKGASLVPRTLYQETVTECLLVFGSERVQSDSTGPSDGQVGCRHAWSERRCIRPSPAIFKHIPCH